jgi:acetyl-CoA carboxylase carboxyltransferase component
MGPDQLSGVMETVQANSAKAKGIELDPEQVKASTQAFRDRVQQDSESYRTSASLLDDGIIDPRDTRDVIGMCLDVVQLPGVQGTAAHRVLARM